MQKIYSLFFIAAFLASACSTAESHKSDQHKPNLILQSNSPVVKLSMPGKSSIDWTIRPDWDVDPLILECPEKEDITVKFESDIESLDFQLSGYEEIFFDIKVGDVSATTQIKCTMKLRNYRDGNYAKDRIMAGDYEADLKPIFDAYIMDDEPGGILTIWDKGTLTYEYAAGLGDIDKKSQRRVIDAFDIASVTKEFTAFAILKLIEDNKLSLETKLERFFPNLPNADKVTIYHLLTHTHGLPDFTYHEDYDASQPMEIETALDTLSKMEPEFLPGTQYEYGNTSFRILGLISPLITGQAHNDFVRENLFKPAGMTESGFVSSEKTRISHVQGYDMISGKPQRSVKNNHPSHEVGVGDILSTFNDLQKWYRALSTGKIVSQATFAQAMAPQTLNDGTTIDRGLGFFAGKYNGERVIYNSGDDDTHTRYIYFIDRDRFVGLNTNNTIEHHEYIASELYLHVVGKLIHSDKFYHWDEEIDLADL